MIDKKLYELALSNFTSNSYETINDILDNDDWTEVDIWEPFENRELSSVKDLVKNLYDQFIGIKNGTYLEELEEEFLYYDIHVFLNRYEGYSVFIKYPINLPQEDENLIEYAKTINNRILEDADYIDRIDEITEKEYNEYTS